MNNVLIRKRRRKFEMQKKRPKEENHVEMEAKAGILLPQTKEPQEPAFCWRPGEAGMTLA